MLSFMVWRCNHHIRLLIELLWKSDWIAMEPAGTWIICVLLSAKMKEGLKIKAWLWWQMCESKLWHTQLLISGSHSFPWSNKNKTLQTFSLSCIDFKLHGPKLFWAFRECNKGPWIAEYFAFHIFTHSVFINTIQLVSKASAARVITGNLKNKLWNNSSSCQST